MAITLTTKDAFKTSLGLGTAADLDVGTGANNILQLDSNGKVPAGLDASLLSLSGGKLKNVYTQSGSSQYAFTTNVNIMNITVTPVSANSKFLLLYSDSAMAINTGGLSLYSRFDRGGTGLGNYTRLEAGGHMRKPINLITVDAPNTTSSITYNVNMYLQSGGTGYVSYSSGKRTFFVIEYED